MKSLIVILLVAFAATLSGAEVEKAAPVGLEQFILEKAKEYTGKSEDAFGKALDVAQEEVPATVTEFIVWRSWYHGISLAILLGIGIPALFVRPWRHWKNASRVYKEWLVAVRDSEAEIEANQQHNGYVTRIVLGFACIASGAVCALVGICQHLFPFVQILVAPRIYILEEVAKWLK